jgi:hypothetical protein
MTRVLTMQRTIVPHGERKRYLERLRLKRDHYKRANCRFWVFEESALPGAFLEFMEAESADALSAALTSAPDPVVDAGRVYQEVELS